MELSSPLNVRDTMAEQLKHFFSPALVRRLASDLERAEPSFPTSKFVRQATRGLEELELMDRARHICRALRDHLPEDYPTALAILLRSLGPEHGQDELLGGGMGPFFYLPHTMFVAEYGLEHFDLSLEAQHELTRRFTAEFSIRPYIEEDPERTFRKLKIWAKDKNPHVRRLVSEGTRLRLPWGARVRWLTENPERVLALLEPLKSDPASLVRRSVANHLNDLSKDYPELTLQTCERWLQGASVETQALVRHALRSLVKKGHRGALELLGVGARPKLEVRAVELSAKTARIGETVRFSFELKSSARQSQELAVDYAVHFVKASGATSPKVFKLKRLTLAAGSSATLSGRIALSQMTTRKHYPGLHRVELLVNGVTFPLAEFKLRA